MSFELEHEPAVVVNGESRSPFLLVCEHAGQEIPAALGLLGLTQAEIDDHYGWEIGALELARGIARTLDAQLVYQRYSRLVIDCNRPLGSHELTPEASEAISIPGNVGLPEPQRRERIEKIWQPFQQAVSLALDKRLEASGRAILMAVHSFSPVFHQENRPWQVCLAYNRDDRMARILLDELVGQLPAYRIVLNQPFIVSDADDQTIPAFGEGRGIPHLLLEVRNDLVRTSAGQQFWAQNIARAVLNCQDKLMALC